MDERQRDNGNFGSENFPEAIAARTGHGLDTVQEILSGEPELRPVPQTDYPALLDLQKLCYRREADLYDDDRIPPMTQTLAELDRVLAVGTGIIGLYRDGELIGSVRGRLDHDTVHIGRLIVDPRYQGKGYGRKLLTAMEAFFAEARQAELFTGTRSLSNVRFYTGCGYEIFKTGRLEEGITLVYFRKELKG